MVLRMHVMKRATVVATAMLALAGFGLWPSAGAIAQAPGAAQNDGAARKRVRPPARIRVHPLVQSYPGPASVRQCAAWLDSEYRPSGTVIVPKMHCWWEGG
jgi:hypothetical protein